MKIETEIHFDPSRPSFPWLLNLKVDGVNMSKYPNLGYHEMFETRWGAKHAARRLRKNYRKWAAGKTGTIVEVQE